MACSSGDSKLATWEFLRERFVTGDYFFAGVEGLVFKSDKDTVVSSSKNDHSFENKKVIKHD